MIPLTDKKATVSLDSSLESRGFEMEASAEAFNAVFDTLYSNKILSPKREYLTNAADSHIDAGNMEPFSVQLPTSLDPTFKVRDNGTGLSKEDVYHYFAGAFRSKKGGTNKQTGYLGLGSKSIFAYTDSGTLRSRFNGVESLFLLARAEDGMPTVTFISDTPTDEHNGIEISWAVAPSDIEAYRRAASDLLLGFRGYPVQPKFNIPVETGYGEPIWSDKDIEVYKGHSRFGTDLMVRQGPVLYPVPADLNSIGTTNGYLVIITVPIGTLGVATSREALSLTPSSRAVLVKTLEEAKEKFKESLNSEIKKCSSYAEACKTYLTKFSFVSGSLSYDGKPVQRNAIVEIPGLTFKLSQWDQFGQYSVPSFNWSEVDSLTFYYIEGATPSKAREIYNLNCKRGVVISGATPKLLAEFKDLLDLQDDQLIDFNTLAIPLPLPVRTWQPVPRYDANKHKDLRPYIILKRQNRNYYPVSSGDWEQVQDPSQLGEYFWLPCDRRHGKITFEVVNKDGGTKTVSNLENLFTRYSLLEKALSNSSNYTPMNILVFTPKMIELYKPPANRRFDRVLRNLVKRNTTRLIRTITVANMTPLERERLDLIKPSLVTTYRKKVIPNLPVRDSYSLLQIYNIPSVDKSFEETKEKIKQDYAALFAGGHNLRDEYIRLRNLELKQKTKEKV